MTREEQIDRLQNIIDRYEGEDMWQTLTDKRDYECIKAAIEALEQEPKYCDRNICIRNDYNGIGCGECEVTKSGEPCEDCISRQAVHEAVEKWAGSMNVLIAFPPREVRPLLDSIHTLPPVTPQPKTGHWIKFVVNGRHKIRCDKCDYIGAEHVIYTRNYCPNCGAKMVESQESEEA